MLLYSTDVWSPTVASQRRPDTFNQWYILRIPYTAHVSNAEAGTGQSPITTVIKQRRLKLSGHVARADLAEDHSHALQASLNI